jgi:hypothetical protein
VIAGSLSIIPPWWDAPVVAGDQAFPPVLANVRQRDSRVFPNFTRVGIAGCSAWLSAFAAHLHEANPDYLRWRFWRGVSALFSGGGRGIRTPGTLSSSTVFKTAGLNRSPIPPLTILPDVQDPATFAPSRAPLGMRSTFREDGGPSTTRSEQLVRSILLIWRA